MKICVVDKSGRITIHYSTTEIGNLFKAANKVCDTTQNINSPTLAFTKMYRVNSCTSSIKGNLYKFALV
ncbi:hypothetical protein GAMM_210005 [Gammaproteobacteria bacterium]